MKNKKSFVLGMLAAVLALGVVFTACGGGKKNSGGGGSSSDGGSAAAAKAPKASGKESPASDFSYDLAEGGAGVVIRMYTGNGGKVVIPAKIEGLPVVEIGGGAFNAERGEGGYNMTSVVIPAGVKTIGGYAFRECEKLTSVTIQGSEVTVENYAFYKCVELAELNIPDGDKALIPEVSQYGSVAVRAFEGCKKLPLAMRSRLNAMGFTSI